MKKVVLFLSCIVFTVAVLNQCRQNQNNAAVANEDGARLFRTYCATCHLANGTGGPAPQAGLNAPDIREFTKSKAELIDIISNGFGKMPSFKDSTSDENISMIATYVATQIERHSTGSSASAQGQ
jgi:mono/diheme cytochrome c family protein